MFGTVARIKVKAGNEEELLAVQKEWTQENGTRAGQIAGYIFQLDERPREYLLVGIFPDRDEYYRFAAQPETDRWYQRMRDLLESDPEWNDGEVIQSDVFARI